METINEAAIKYVANLSEGDVFGRLKQPRGAGVELVNAFTAGTAFAQRWISIGEELPSGDAFIGKNKNGHIAAYNGSYTSIFIKAIGITHWRYIELR